MTIGCYQGDYSSWDNAELCADVTIGCYYGDYSSCDNHHSYIRFYLEQIFFTHTLVTLVIIIRRRRREEEEVDYRHNSVTLIVIDLVIVPFFSKSL